MDALSISAVGMVAATRSFDASAARETADPVSQTIDQVEAKSAFEASAAVFKTADRMLGALLDLKV